MGSRVVGLLRRRLVPMVGRAAAFLGILTLLVLIAGRVLGERTLWTQYLSWTPVGLGLLFALGCWATSWVLERLGTRLAGTATRAVLLIAILVGTTLWMTRDLGVHRAPTLLARGERPPDAIRIGYWNLAGVGAGYARWTSVVEAARRREAGEATPEDIALLTRVEEEIELVAQAIIEVDPDVLILVNRPPWLVRSALEAAVESQGRAQRVTIGGASRVHVASRVDVVRTGWVSLSSEEPDGPLGWSDQSVDGGVASIELASDAPSVVGRAVWVVDLPSHLGLWRPEVMRRARTAIDGWHGDQPVGGVMPRRVGPPDPSWVLDRWWAEPSVVIGDFNTPAGARSVRTLVDDRRDAFDVAGFGLRATWPSRRKDPVFWPIAQWAVDRAYVSDDVEPWRVRRAGGSLALHRMVLLDAVLPGVVVDEVADAID